MARKTKYQKLEDDLKNIQNRKEKIKKELEEIRVKEADISAELGKLFLEKTKTNMKLRGDNRPISEVLESLINENTELKNKKNTGI